MHEMPDEWQEKMAALLEEADAMFPNVPDLDTTVLCKKDGKFTKTPSWLAYRHPDFETIKTFKE